MKKYMIAIFVMMAGMDAIAMQEKQKTPFMGSWGEGLEDWGRGLKKLKKGRLRFGRKIEREKQQEEELAKELAKEQAKEQAKKEQKTPFMGSLGEGLEDWGRGLKKLKKGWLRFGRKIELEKRQAEEMAKEQAEEEQKKKESLLKKMSNPKDIEGDKKYVITAPEEAIHRVKELNNQKKELERGIARDKLELKEGMRTQSALYQEMQKAKEAANAKAEKGPIGETSQEQKNYQEKMKEWLIVDIDNGSLKKAINKNEKELKDQEETINVYKKGIELFIKRQKDEQDKERKA